MKKLFCILLSATLLLTLSACGASVSKDAESAPMMPMPGESANGSYDMGFDMPAASPAEPEEAPAPVPTPEQSVSSTLPENVKMIYRGYLQLESTAFDAAVTGLTELVSKMGGYFETSELNNYSKYRIAYYVVRVPAAQYQAFCSQVGDLAQLNSQRHTAENISEAYYDTESRLLTQRTKLERLQELLSKAENMEDIITLESAIADTELQIEYLTGTLRKYDALVDFATVEINLNEVYVLSEVEQPVIGFWPKLGQAFVTGTSRFVDDVQDFVISFARNWVSSLIWMAIWVCIIVLVVRKLRKRAGKPLFSRKKKEPPVLPPQQEEK